MKKKFKKIVSVVCVVALVFCIAEIFVLKDEINTLKNNSTYQYEHLSRSINNIYDNVDSMLEKETQLIYGVEWDYGEIKRESNTVELILTATAKKYTEEKTTFEIFCNGKGYPMSNTNGKLKSVFEVPLFSDVNVEKIVLTTDDTIETQKLDLYNITPKKPLLVSVSADLSSWQSTGEIAGDDVIVKLSGILGVKTKDNRSSADITQAALVSFVDSEETARIPLGSLEMLGDDYKGIERKTGYDYYRLDAVSFSVPKGKNMQLKFEVKDDFGYIYRVYILRVNADVNGYLKCDNPYTDGTEVYNTDGRYLGEIIF